MSQKNVEILNKIIEIGEKNIYRLQGQILSSGDTLLSESLLERILMCQCELQKSLNLFFSRLTIGD